MLASAMVLPDWLYKTQKRLMVETVGVAIIDGASRPSDHAAGVWALAEIDDLLEIDGAAACMAELRLRFGRRVQQLLEAAARLALGLPETRMVTATPPLAAAGSTTSLHARRFGTLRAIPRVKICEDVTDDGKDQGAGCRCGSCEEPSFDDDDDGRDDPEALADDVVSWPPEHIRVGFARRLLDA